MKGFRTLAIAALLAALGVIQQADLATVVPPGFEGVVLGIVVALMAGLRAITDGPIGRTPDR